MLGVAQPVFSPRKQTISVTRTSHMPVSSTPHQLIFRLYALLRYITAHTPIAYAKYHLYDC
jgi:hypothetical protein